MELGFALNSVFGPLRGAQNAATAISSSASGSLSGWSGRASCRLLLQGNYLKSSGSFSTRSAARYL